MNLDARKTAVLVQILAKTDALFWPLRFDREVPANAGVVWERRRAFPRRGVDFVVGGNQAERKEGERLLGEIESAGLIVQPQVAGRRGGVRLTEKGDDIARALTANHLARDSWPLLWQIKQQREPCLEVYVLGPKADYGKPKVDERIAELHMRLQPLYARGLITSHNDLQMHVGLFLTETGQSAAMQPPPVVTVDLPEYSPEAGDLYDVHFGAAQEAMHRWRGSREIVIPLSAGNWPERRKVRAKKARQ